MQTIINEPVLHARHRHDIDQALKNFPKQLANFQVKAN
jgi:hypothetical protein